MSFRTFRTFAATLGVCVLSMIAVPTWAPDYPNKPITFLVPFGAGSGTDQVARLYGKAVSEALKVPVVVENKGGASGFIAAQQMARTAPDGYTVFITTNTTQVANPYLFEKVPYDPVRTSRP
jgi:tripartite-type tricarboxylate transporter receptor subunit TctC